jgi:hypothetical protein
VCHELYLSIMLMVAQSGSSDAEVLRLLCSRHKGRLLGCISGAMISWHDFSALKHSAHSCWPGKHQTNALKPPSTRPMQRHAYYLRSRSHPKPPSQRRKYPRLLVCSPCTMQYLASQICHAPILSTHRASIAEPQRLVTLVQST